MISSKSNIPDENAAVTVLIIGDMRNAIDMTQRFVERGGYRALREDSAADGITRALEVVPDIILIEIEELVDGYDVARVLRNHQTTAHIPLVAVSAILHEREKALKNGFEGYIQKPIMFPHLLTTIKSLLNER